METARLILRAPRPDDVDEIMAIEYSPFVLKYNAITIQSREDFQKKLQSGAEEQSMLYLEEKESGRIAGAVFVDPDQLRHKVNACCLAYYLGEAYTGRGYMAEALQAVLANLFQNREMDVVSARVFSENAASLRLLERLGFVREGYLRHCVLGYGGIVYDDVVFSMLKTEYLSR